MIHIDELTDQLGIDPDSADLELLETLETQAVAFVQTQTGRYFGPIVAVTEIIEGGATKRLWLADVPATPPVTNPATPTTVVEESSYAGATAVAFADAVDYVLRDNMLVRLGSAAKWSAGYEYLVTYYHGYAEDAEPADIRKLVIDLVGLWYDGTGETTGLKSETIGGYSYTRGTAEDLAAIPGAAEIIAKWKRPVGFA